MFMTNKVITQKAKIGLYGQRRRWITSFMLLSALPVTGLADTGNAGIVALTPLSSYQRTAIAPSHHSVTASIAQSGEMAVSEHTPPQTKLSVRMESAMQAVSRLYQIPLGLLHAISVTESGIDNQPWPWTLNVYGVPYRFTSATQTEQAVKNFFQRGIALVDIGPMQVDWQYHHRQFGHLAAAINPLRNIAVAGRILKNDYDQTGSWRAAVGLYHGGGPQRQATYIRQVFSRWNHRGGAAVTPENPLTFPTVHAGGLIAVQTEDTQRGNSSASMSDIVALVAPTSAIGTKG